MLDVGYILFDDCCSGLFSRYVRGVFSIGATLSHCTKFDCSYIVSNEMKLHT